MKLVYKNWKKKRIIHDSWLGEIFNYKLIKKNITLIVEKGLIHLCMAYLKKTKSENFEWILIQEQFFCNKHLFFLSFL